VGPAFEEQPGEHARRGRMGRDEGTAPGPGQTETLARQDQAGESRLAADVRSGELVERDAVAEARPDLRVRGGGQEAEEGIVTGADGRVRQSGDDREVVPQLAENLQVG